MKVNIHEAKTTLSRLLARVAGGEEVIIAKSGRPIARLVPYEQPGQQRRSGRYEGQGSIADDFDAPLGEFEADFYGS